MFWTVRAVLPKMLEHGGGSIINMASVAGSIKGIANQAAVTRQTYAADGGMTI